MRANPEWSPMQSMSLLSRARAGAASTYVITLALAMMFAHVPDAAAAAPYIMGTPPTNVAPGEWYEYTFSASDADGDPVTWSIRNMPSWASFYMGTLQGHAPAGTYSNIEIMVSD